MPALFSIHTDENDITCMLRTHVDDILWAADDEIQKLVHSVLAEFDSRGIRGNVEKIEGASYLRDSPLTRSIRDSSLPPSPHDIVHVALEHGAQESLGSSSS
eukprot:3385472-Pyramimonas_sp.AAC.1